MVLHLDIIQSHQTFNAEDSVKLVDYMFQEVEDGGCGLFCSWAIVSGVAAAFRILFSNSNWLFFSISSFICSFSTSTSSLTANIRWLFTRSWKKTNNTYIIQSLFTKQLSYQCLGYIDSKSECLKFTFLHDCIFEAHLSWPCGWARQYFRHIHWVV